MTRRVSTPSGASRTALAAKAVWLSLCVSTALLDALARGWSGPHLLFLAAALTPLILDRVAAVALPEGAASALGAITWLTGAAALSLTADAGGWPFLAWLILPAVFAGGRGGSARSVLEALGLGGLAAVGLLAARSVDVETPAWSYGAMPLASALGVAAFIAFAGGRVLGMYRRRSARAGVNLRRMAAILDASPDVFLRLDQHNRVSAADGGGDGKLADDARVYLGADAASLFAPSDAARFNQALERVRRIGEPERLVLAGEDGLIEARLVRTDVRDVMLLLRPASAEVEALPLAERERDAAEAAARARSRFFASMSHELRTPLNAVLGFSDVMRLKMFGPMPAKYAEYADDIHNSAKHLLDLVGDLLDVSKIEAGRYDLEISRFDAREALHAAARMMRPAAEAGKVEFEIEAGDEPIEVEADLRALKQMLLNLTSNAVKFTRAGGSVRVSAFAADTALVIEVTDTGPGLTPEDISRIARPFEQTREGRRHPSRSSGLGLALVRSLCDLHRGRLEIESEPGRGATFRLRLPVLADAHPANQSMDARGRLQRVRDAGFAEPSEGAAEEG